MYETLRATLYHPFCFYGNLERFLFELYDTLITHQDNKGLYIHFNHGVEPANAAKYVLLLTFDYQNLPLLESKLLTKHNFRSANIWHFLNDLTDWRSHRKVTTPSLIQQHPPC